MDSLPPALSDITVNVPGHTYLPEESTFPTRTSACCGTARSRALRPSKTSRRFGSDMESKRPEMPSAAANLFERARIKAFANEHRIKSVSVTGGKLVVEPIEVPRSKMTLLRRAGGRYLEESAG